MGFLKSLRGNKKEKNGTPGGTPAGTESSESPGPVPTIDVDKAAAVIEARHRGNLARKQTSQLMAHREGADSDNPFLKCLPCLAPKWPLQ